MKKVKGMLATLLILTMLVGSIGLTYASESSYKENTPKNGVFTTLDDPKPIIF